MNQAVLANVEISRAGTASPVVLAARGDVVLKRIDARERALAEAHDFLENLALSLTERLELPAPVVEYAHSRRKSQLDGALGDCQSVFRMVDAAAEHGIDVDVKIGVLGKQLQLLVEHLQTFFRDFIRHRVVDADLQEFEAGAIEALDSVGSQQISIGDHPGNHPAVADAADDVVKLGMKQRLAAADRNHGSAERREAVNAAEHLLQRHRLREIVEFVAIGAGEIAAADGNDVREKRMPG